MHSTKVIARALAAALLAGPLEQDSLVERGARLLGRRWRWLLPLSRRICGSFGSGPHPRRVALADFILKDSGFLRACEHHDVTVVERLGTSPRMEPVEVASSWSVPNICTAGDLADWLSISLGDLAWFADLRGLEYKRSQGKLRHYRYLPLVKRNGRIRLVEAPKPRLKDLQRQILTGILDQIPLHAAAHGFRHARSIKSFAAPHVGKHVVLRLDLQEFFPSISVARIQAWFRTAGYPESVADLLAGLCTNSTPTDIWDDDLVAGVGQQLRSVRWRYSRPHIPQGAPTSPALANLAAYGLDCRLAGLAHSAAATYTRYADDLAFSGESGFARGVKRFYLHVCATVIEEGFAVQHRKTRIMHRGVRQRLAGIVVNDRLNVRRADYERLKAALTNCARHGAASQNRAGHDNFRAQLLGRISFVQMVNPARGQRLRELFDQILW